MNLSKDKERLLEIVTPGNAYIVTGEAGTGKTLAGLLCGAKLLKGRPKWQRVLYLTYSKLAKWQIIETAAELVSHGLLDRETRARMDIQNYHSLWWDLLCKHHAFLGIAGSPPRLLLTSELRRLVTDELDRLPVKERPAIVPPRFLRQADRGYNAKKRRCLEEALSGDALLYSKWGCEHYGKDAREFAPDGNSFIQWASDRIKARNTGGKLSHDETVWWACKLLETHPVAANLMKAIYHAMIIDEFQDIDISQWETTRLILPETVVAMGDVKQTIHRWRGAEPEQRFADLRAYCSDPARYLRITQFELIEKNRSPKDMSAMENIDAHLVKTSEYKSQRQLFVLRKSKVAAIGAQQQGTVGVLCASNSMAQRVCECFRTTETVQTKNGSWLLHKVRCARLGVKDSPFENARELTLTVLDYSEASNWQSLWLYVANDLAWNVMGLGENRMPKCGPRSIKEEPVRRRDSAKEVVQTIREDFARGLLSINGFIRSLEQYHDCYSDRVLLRCIVSVGKMLTNAGRHSWERLSGAEKRHKIDSLVLQYENAQAGRMHESVYVMTVHQAKGREFNTVIIPWFTAEKWDPADAHSWDLNEPDVKEMFHTACTRAKGDQARVITIGLSPNSGPIQGEQERGSDADAG